MEQRASSYDIVHYTKLHSSYTDFIPYKMEQYGCPLEAVLILNEIINMPLYCSTAASIYFIFLFLFFIEPKASNYSSYLLISQTRYTHVIQVQPWSEVPTPIISITGIVFPLHISPTAILQFYIPSKITFYWINSSPICQLSNNRRCYQLGHMYKCSKHDISTRRGRQCAMCKADFGRREKIIIQAKRISSTLNTIHDMGSAPISKRKPNACNKPFRRWNGIRVTFDRRLITARRTSRREKLFRTLIYLENCDEKPGSYVLRLIEKRIVR